MGQMYRKWDRIMELFYEWPQKKFTVRGIAKATKIPKTTVQRYLQMLKAEGILSKENKAVVSDLYKIKKINYYIEMLFRSGLIFYLEKQLSPSCLILFGSLRKGESVRESDIDIFVETTKKKDVDLTLFEKKLRHKIQFFMEAKITDLPDRLFNNVVNGIKLKGEFKIR